MPLNQIYLAVGGTGGGTLVNDPAALDDGAGAFNTLWRSHDFTANGALYVGIVRSDSTQALTTAQTFGANTPSRTAPMYVTTVNAAGTEFAPLRLPATDLLDTSRMQRVDWGTAAVSAIGTARSWVQFRNLYISATRDATYNLWSTAAESYFEGCRFESGGTGTNQPTTMNAAGNNAHFANCDFIVTRGSFGSIATFNSVSNARLFNCRVIGPGNSGGSGFRGGAYINSGSITAYNTVFANIPVDGFTLDTGAATPHFFENCVFYNCGSDGVSIAASAANAQVTFKNCVFASCTGIGLNIASATAAANVINCRFWGNGTNFAGALDWAWGASAGNNITTAGSASEFENAAAGVFYTARTAPGYFTDGRPIIGLVRQTGTTAVGGTGWRENWRRR